MSVPSTVADLSATAALNSPSGSESIGTNLDDYLRAHAAIIRQVSDAKANSGANADITSLSGLSGNLAFTGTGNRITGDFSNATTANRVMFQTSTVNSKTSLNAVPNGTGVGSEVVLFSNVDPSNSSYAAMTTDNTAMTVIAGKIGTGTYLPLTFSTSGSERLRIDTSGNLLIATTGKLQFSTAGYSIRASSGLEIDAADFTRITIAGVEKFRFGASGQLGIGGATYGTAGQILTSGGPSAAPTWSNAASGGISPSYFTTPSTISNNSVQSMAHGLGARPNHITINLLVTTANGGWSVGDLISGSGISVSGTADTVIQVGADATNIIVGCGIGSLAVLNKITGAVAASAVSNFKVYVGVSL